MSYRINLSKFLLRLGGFIQSLPVVIMKPDNLVEFSRQSYARPEDVASWSKKEILDAGLSPDEKRLLESINPAGSLLLLGVGGGREAIPLAEMGFQVTGVDFVPAMVDQAIANAAARGLTINGLVQEISRLDVPAGSCDVVWLSRSMYSCVPTRKRRVEMVRRIGRALKPGGYFLCQFHHGPGAMLSRKGLFLRRMIAVLCLGNMNYEPGDMLWQNIEFVHAFSSDDSVRLEIEAGGLTVVRFMADDNPIRRGVICRKTVAVNQGSA